MCNIRSGNYLLLTSYYRAWFVTKGGGGGGNENSFLLYLKYVATRGINSECKG